MDFLVHIEVFIIFLFSIIIHLKKWYAVYLYICKSHEHCLRELGLIILKERRLKEIILSKYCAVTGK